MSGKGGTAGMNKARSFRDRKTVSPMGKNRSATSARSPLRWTPQTKAHDCLSYSSRSKDLESSRETFRDRKETERGKRKPVKEEKDAQMYSGRPRHLDASLDWKSTELATKHADMDTGTCSAFSHGSKDGSLEWKDSELGMKKTEKDSCSGLNLSAFSSRSKNLDGSLEWKDSEEKKAVSLDDKLFTGANDPNYDKYARTTNGTDTELLPSNRKAKVMEFENSTISKQRAELQLLISELKDRDRELNEMVLSHQRQIGAWDSDRKKILVLEERCNQFEKEIGIKNDELRQVVAKLNTTQSDEQNKATALTSTRQQLAQLTELHSQDSHKLSVLQEKYSKTKAAVKEQEDHITQMETRENELLEMLKHKDKDLSESSTTVVQMNSKIQRLEGENQDFRRLDSELKRQVAEWKNKQKEIWKEYEHSKRELVKREQMNDDLKTEVKRHKQEIATLKKEVMLAGERERRKTQVLELQKSKQERTESELNHLRSLYERQQKDLAMLQLNFENTKDLLSLHQKQSIPHHHAVGYSSSLNLASDTTRNWGSTDRQSASKTETSPSQMTTTTTNNTAHLSPRYSHYSHISSVSHPSPGRPRVGVDSADDDHYQRHYPVLPEPPSQKHHDSSLTTEDSYMARQSDKNYGEESYDRGATLSRNPLEDSLVSDIVDDEDYSGNYTPLRKRSYTVEKPTIVAATESYKRSTEAGLSHHDAAEIDRILAKHLGSNYKAKGAGADGKLDHSAPVIGDDRHMSYGKEYGHDVTASAPDMITSPLNVNTDDSPEERKESSWPFVVTSDQGPDRNTPGEVEESSGGAQRQEIEEEDGFVDRDATPTPERDTEVDEEFPQGSSYPGMPASHRSSAHQSSIEKTSAQGSPRSHRSTTGTPTSHRSSVASGNGAQSPRSHTSSISNSPGARKIRQGMSGEENGVRSPTRSHTSSVNSSIGGTSVSQGTHHSSGENGQKSLGEETSLPSPRSHASSVSGSKTPTASQRSSVSRHSSGGNSGKENGALSPRSHTSSVSGKTPTASQRSSVSQHSSASGKHSGEENVTSPQSHRSSASPMPEEAQDEANPPVDQSSCGMEKVFGDGNFEETSMTANPEHLPFASKWKQQQHLGSSGHHSTVSLEYKVGTHAKGTSKDVSGSAEFTRSHDDMSRARNGALFDDPKRLSCGGGSENIKGEEYQQQVQGSKVNIASDPTLTYSSSSCYESCQPSMSDRTFVGEERKGGSLEEEEETGEKGQLGEGQQDNVSLLGSEPGVNDSDISAAFGATTVFSPYPSQQQQHESATSSDDNLSHHCIFSDGEANNN